MLSDTLEALIAYLYLDTGEQNTQKFVDTYVYSLMEGLPQEPGKSAKKSFARICPKVIQAGACV
ncbi:MAG: hypothetical protein H6765_05815 [Candidatus Peribacteria bacterium]|nr:MAG: hypothetical protein H6765_05815 [Candidatus Peribacteria bacterium]